MLSAFLLLNIQDLMEIVKSLQYTVLELTNLVTFYLKQKRKLIIRKGANMKTYIYVWDMISRVNAYR